MAGLAVPGRGVGARLGFVHKNRGRPMPLDAGLGKPTQNAFVESFNGRFRDECLNDTLLSTLAEACSTITT